MTNYLGSVEILYYLHSIHLVFKTTTLRHRAMYPTGEGKTS